MISSPDQWQTIPDILPAARLALSPPAWAFSGSGPETEVTVRRNRAAFDRLALMPRVLRGVADRDLSRTLLGHRLSLPVVLAPVGSIQMFHPEGSRPSARVAEQVGTFSFVATDRKSTRLNSSHGYISYAVFCLKKKKIQILKRYNTYTG